VPSPRPLDVVAIRTSFARFRVASIVEGIALLVLVVIMTMRYLVFGGDALFTSTSPFWEHVSSVWSPIHGLIYMIYVVLGFDLWIKMRWALPRMALLMFFGVIPVLSFFGERWTHQAVESDIARRPTLQDEAGAAGGA
jgi:integral membrane protein